MGKVWEGSEFYICTYEHDFMTSQLQWTPVTVQYATSTSAMQTLVASSAHTELMDFCSEAGDILCQVVNTLKIANIFIFVQSCIFNEERTGSVT